MKISKFHYEVITHPYIQVYKTLKLLNFLYIIILNYQNI